MMDFELTFLSFIDQNPQSLRELPFFNLQEKSEWDETVNSLNVGILTLTALHARSAFFQGRGVLSKAWEIGGKRQKMATQFPAHPPYILPSFGLSQK